MGVYWRLENCFGTSLKKAIGSLKGALETYSTNDLPLMLLKVRTWPLGTLIFANGWHEYCMSTRYLYGKYVVCGSEITGMQVVIISSLMLRQHWLQRLFKIVDELPGGRAGACVMFRTNSGLSQHFKGKQALWFSWDSGNGQWDGCWICIKRGNMLFFPSFQEKHLSVGIIYLI